MEENRIYISEEKTEYRMLPMNGRDSQGNFYEADALSLKKNGKRFLPVMGEFHFSRYEPKDWEEELLKIKGTYAKLWQAQENLEQYGRTRFDSQSKRKGR